MKTSLYKCIEILGYYQMDFRLLILDTAQANRNLNLFNILPLLPE